MWFMSGILRGREVAFPDGFDIAPDDISDSDN